MIEDVPIYDLRSEWKNFFENMPEWHIEFLIIRKSFWAKKFTKMQIMSERRSFFRERKVSAVLFRQIERKVSAAQKNGERERKTRSFLPSFLLVFGSETFWKYPHFS